MKLQTILFLLLALVIAFFGTIIGVFIFPFIIWLTGIDDLAIMSFIISLLLFPTIALALLYLKKATSKFFIAILLSLILPILLSSFITVCRFGESGRSLDKYLCRSSNLYNKFGIKLIKGRYNYWRWGYDDDKKIFINFETYHGNTLVRYDIYDKNLNYIESSENNRVDYYDENDDSAWEYLEHKFELM